jgi:uncharacterized protein
MIKLRIASVARGLALAFGVVVAAATISISPTCADPAFPELNGQRVIDDAHVLPPQTQAALTQKLADLEAKTTDQMVVVTVPSLQGDSIEDYGYKLGRKWGIGQKGTNNGVLFIVAPSEHKVRIEVGYGLEDVMTDALSSVILQEKVLPKFRGNDIPGGVNDGVDAVITQLTLDKGQAVANVHAAETQARTAPVHHHGGGFPFQLIIFLIVIVLVVFGRMGFWPLLLLGGGRGFGGGGGWSSGGGGGGGFSGGGGSFGGGGASGGW